jgi:hypothetical protein
MSKLDAWSESRGQYDDVTHGIGDFGGDSDVSTKTVKRGIIPLCDCEYCGRQWKGLVPWAEVAMFYVGQSVPGTKATRQGILTSLRCNGCGKSFTMVIDWGEVQKWVDVGIRTGCLDPRIKQARPR